MSDYKTSLLVSHQVPEFIRDENPLFVAFLEAYYEFLENKQGSKKNDLLNQAKKFRNISDVDSSISEFEDNFFNTYATLIPKDLQVDKEFLIKNVLPLYLSKGNEKSFQLLFRMLFNDELNINLPKNNVLRASDGKWTVDNILKIGTNIRTVYTGNGANTQFVVPQTVSSGEIQVYVGDVLQTENTDYSIRKETRKIVFSSAPVANSTIKVYYDNFDITLLANRKVRGSVSGSSAIVERASKRIITDGLYIGLPYEIFVDAKTLVGRFTNGESILSDIVDSNGVVINFEADTFSSLVGIEIVDGGSRYNVGDPVFVYGGGASSSATALVDKISTGYITRLVVNYGGAGFKLTSLVNSYGTIANTIFNGAIDGIDTTTGLPTTYNVTNDIISTYGSTLISAASYGFPGAFTGNSATRIVDVLNPLTVTGLGVMTNVSILLVNVSSNITTFDSQGALYAKSSGFGDIKDFNSVGRIDVYGGGTGYKVGDEVYFGPNPTNSFGIDAAAAVASVNASGGIIRVDIQAPRITGTANVLNNSVQIVGTGTNFTNDLRLGDRIIIAGQSRYINSITSSTAANVNVSFTFTDSTIWSNNRNIGAYYKNQLGGVNYTQDSFPTITVANTSGGFTGSGANIAITALMGNGEKLTGYTNDVLGKILALRLTTGGSGYEYIPQVDLTGHGDGAAVGLAVLGPSYSSLPGRWTTSDSILSTSERKLAGRDYYTDYSYVTASFTEFSKYKQILKNLLHPAGFVNYSDLNTITNVYVGDSTISTNSSTTLSGTINVNATIYVTGNNTLFNIANGNTINIGSTISVNGYSRTINTIISNTQLTVSPTGFVYTANDQQIIIS